VISWKATSRFKSDPEAAASIIMKAQSESPDGVCQAQAVVDAARPKSSPIHEDFEWNDAVAAEEARRYTARSMIRMLVVVVESHEPRPMFCNIRVGDTKGYLPVEVALSKRSTRNELLGNALRDAAAFKSKYSLLVEMAGVIQAINDLE
jgi:hypothetical protein